MLPHPRVLRVDHPGDVLAAIPSLRDAAPNVPMSNVLAGPGAQGWAHPSSRHLLAEHGTADRRLGDRSDERRIVEERAPERRAARTSLHRLQCRHGSVAVPSRYSILRSRSRSQSTSSGSSRKRSSGCRRAQAPRARAPCRRTSRSSRPQLPDSITVFGGAREAAPVRGDVPLHLRAKALNFAGCSLSAGAPTTRRGLFRR